MPGALQQARAQAAPLFAKWPDPVREPLIEHHLTAAWRAGLCEDRNPYEEVADELRRAPGLASVPLTDDAGHGWLHEERQDAVLNAVGDLLDGTA
ncbi:hypothetical protein AB0C40_27250 [Streptomyces brevispora]|uniref:hypothetical protein n=1 Tax=Streptomyces brevispora TaxID=887462 RepID=UPI0033E1D834